MSLLRLGAGMGALLFLSEMALAVFQRSARTGATAAKGGSHRLLWVVIMGAIFVAWQVAANGVGPRFAHRNLAALAAVAGGIFLAGSVLRWWAIRKLGRFFTVDVATAADQRVVEDGPYRWMRHPSYTGLLLQFAGLGLAFNNVVAWVIIFAPVTAALMYRICQEEAVLREKLGEAYVAYCARTKRLVPGVF